MANRLTMAQILSIETLLKTGHSQRSVATLLGIDRETVSKYARQFTNAPGVQNQPNAPTGSGPCPATRSPGPDSACEPFRDVILAKLQQGLSAQRIYQDLVAELGFTGKYSSVRRYVARLLHRTDLPVRRMESLPGEEAQVDFGTGAPVRTPDGQIRRPWVFRIVLSCSRKAYSEAVWRQTTESFLTALENAFQSFGGVPRRLVIDNLKAAVQQADWYDPELHPRLQSFAAHYGTVFVPTKPYTPQHKGKVEAGIKYAKNNALKGKRFTSLKALAARHDTAALNRVCGTALAHGAWRLRTLRSLLKREPTQHQSQFEFRDQKTLEDFDWDFNRSVKRKAVFDLAAGEFVRRHRDVLLIGPPGVGKSHLAQAIGAQLIRSGSVVYYRSIFDAVWDFLHDEAFDGHEKVMARYLKPDLLILDDMGMKHLPNRSGKYLFEIIMRRHELKSTLMTSNRPREDWGKLIGDVPAATAILDRFLQQAEVLEMTGKSYRLRHPSGKTASDPGEQDG